MTQKNDFSKLNENTIETNNNKVIFKTINKNQMNDEFWKRLFQTKNKTEWKMG